MTKYLEAAPRSFTQDPLPVSLALPCSRRIQSTFRQTAKCWRRGKEKEEKKKPRQRMWARTGVGEVCCINLGIKRAKPLNGIPLYLLCLCCERGLDRLRPQLQGSKSRWAQVPNSHPPPRPGEARSGAWAGGGPARPAGSSGRASFTASPCSCLLEPLTEKAPQAPSPRLLSGSKTAKVLHNFHSSQSS